MNLESITLAEAICRWAEGTLDRRQPLWGLSIFWWGRVGMALSMSSILLLIAELAGKDRIDTFGHSLRLERSRIPFLLMGSPILGLDVMLRPVWRTTEWGWSITNWCMRNLSKMLVAAVVLVLGVSILELAIGMAAKTELSSWIVNYSDASKMVALGIAGTLALGCSGWLMGMLVLFGGMLASIMIAGIVASVVYPIAVVCAFIGWIVGHEGFEIYLKVGTLLALLLGFLLDILAA